MKTNQLLILLIVFVLAISSIEARRNKHRSKGPVASHDERFNAFTNIYPSQEYSYLHLDDTHKSSGPQHDPSMHGTPQGSLVPPCYHKQNVLAEYPNWVPTTVKYNLDLNLRRRRMRRHRFHKTSHRVHPSTYLYPTNDFAYAGDSGNQMSTPYRAHKLTGTPQGNICQQPVYYPSAWEVLKKNAERGYFYSRFHQRRHKKVHPSTLLYRGNEYSYMGAQGNEMSGPAGAPKIGGTPQGLKSQQPCYPNQQVLGNARLYGKRRFMKKDWPLAYPKEGNYMSAYPPRTKSFSDWQPNDHKTGQTNIPWGTWQDSFPKGYFGSRRMARKLRRKLRRAIKEHTRN